MTAKELYEQLKKEGLENAPLFILIECHSEYLEWWETDKIDGIWIDTTPTDKMVYLKHWPYE